MPWLPTLLVMACSTVLVVWGIVALEVEHLRFPAKPELEVVRDCWRGVLGLVLGLALLACWSILNIRLRRLVRRPHDVAPEVARDARLRAMAGEMGRDDLARAAARAERDRRLAEARREYERSVTEIMERACRRQPPGTSETGTTSPPT